MGRVLALAGLVVALVACSSGSSSYVNNDGTPLPVAKVDFIDSQTFDDSLSDALDAGCGKVVVSPLAPFSINSIPPRLDTWFKAVKENDGSFGQASAPGSGSLRTRYIADIIALVGLVGDIAASDTYAPTEKYNVVLYFDNTTGNVKYVEFTKR